MDDHQVVFLRRLYEMYMYNREQHPINMYNAANSLGVAKDQVLAIVKPIMNDGYIVNNGSDAFTLTQAGIDKLNELDWSAEQAEAWILGKLYDKYLKNSTVWVNFRQPRFDKHTAYFASKNDPPWTTFFREVKRLMSEGVIEREIGGNSMPEHVGVQVRLTPQGYSSELKRRRQLRNKAPTSGTPGKPVASIADVLHAATGILEKTRSASAIEIRSQLRDRNLWAVYDEVKKHLDELVAEGKLARTNGADQYALVDTSPSMVGQKLLESRSPNRPPLVSFMIDI